MTKTDQIFKLTCPYANPFQGNAKRVLFVCSAGLLRSATGATIGSMLGFNTRNCGTEEYALIRISLNLILWADRIYFVNPENYIRATTLFQFDLEALENIKNKTQVLTIEDEFDYMDPKLVQIFRDTLNDYRK